MGGHGMVIRPLRFALVFCGGGCRGAVICAVIRPPLSWFFVHSDLPPLNVSCSGGHDGVIRRVLFLR